MENQENKQPNPNVVDNTPDYLAEIERLKSNTVDKTQYEKLLEDNKKLIQTIARNDERAKANEAAKNNEQPIDINKLREKMFNPNNTLNNLDYIQSALQLRKGLMDKGEPDPFLPIGNKITPTAEDVETAERVAKAFQSCVDYADGDPELFTQELQRITRDNGPRLHR